MARYKVRVPSPGDDLHGDDGTTAIVANTIEQAREFWEDWDGEPAIYLSSYIGRCRVVYKADLECGDCHEDAEPGDTTVDYLVDDGRELFDGEIRCWTRGYDGPTPLVNRDQVTAVIDGTVPPGVKVEHPVWGWGVTLARPLKHRTGWRVLVDFCGLYPHAPWPGAAGGDGGRRWVGWWALSFTQSHTAEGTWPTPTWHVDIGGERIVEGVADENAARTLGMARYERQKAEWEAAQFAAWERERGAVAIADRGVECEPEANA